MKIGGRYNWRGQRELLIYVGQKGVWHQFKKIGDDRGVWCEVHDSDISSSIEQPLESSHRAELPVDQMAHALLAAWAFVRWTQFGECRTHGWDGPPPSAHDVDKLIANALQSLDTQSKE